MAGDQAKVVAVGDRSAQRAGPGCDDRQPLIRTGGWLATAFQLLRSAKASWTASPCRPPDPLVVPVTVRAQPVRELWTSDST
jgi:hypothetical protein